MCLGTWFPVPALCGGLRAATAFFKEYKDASFESREAKDLILTEMLPVALFEDI